MNKKTIRKSVRFSEAENNILLSELKKHNIKFSEFARARILNYKIKSRMELDLIYELKKIGTNLNQIAKVVNSRKDEKINILEKLIEIEIELKKLHK